MCARTNLNGLLADLFFRVTLPPRTEVAAIEVIGETQGDFLDLFAACGSDRPEQCSVDSNDGASDLDILIVARQISSFGFRTGDTFTLRVDLRPIPEASSCLRAPLLREGTTNLPIQTSQNDNTYSPLCDVEMLAPDIVRAIDIPPQSRLDVRLNYGSVFPVRAALSASCDDMFGSCLVASPAAIQTDNATDAVTRVFLVLEPVSSSFSTGSVTVTFSPLVPPP